MRNLGSIFTKSQAPRPREVIDQLSFIFDQVPNLSKGFANAEKKQWWEKKKKFKVGLIRSKDLNTRITIINEHFDFSKRVRNSQSQVKGKVDSDKVKTQGFNLTNNAEETEVDFKPEKLYTAKEFDEMYLGWVEEDTQKSDDEKALIKSIMKQLFRFVFGTKKIVDVNDFHTRLIISYTKLNPVEKIPCTENELLRKHLLQSLYYRLDSVRKEVVASTTVLGEEAIYVDEKKQLLMGLRDIINGLEDKESYCIIYGNDETMKPDAPEKRTLYSSEDYDRLLKIFKSLLLDREQDAPMYNTYEKFRDGLVKGELTNSKKGSDLYSELLRLLDMTTQKKNRELEELLTQLSQLLVLTLRRHKLHIELERLKCKKDCPQDDELEKIKTAAKALNPIITLDQDPNSLINLYNRLLALLQGNPNAGDTLEDLLRRLQALIEIPQVGPGDVPAQIAALQMALQAMTAERDGALERVADLEAAIERMEEAHRVEIDALQAVIRELQIELRVEQGFGERDDREIERLTQELATLQEELATRTRERDEALQRLAEARAEIQRLQEALQEAERQRDAALQQLGEAQQALGQQVAAAAAGQGVDQDALAQLQAQLAAAIQRAEEAEALVVAERRRLEEHCDGLLADAAEAVRVANEARRAAEVARATAEAARGTAEGERDRALANALTAREEAATAEARRVAAEEARGVSDAARAVAEAARDRAIADSQAERRALQEQIRLALARIAELGTQLREAQAAQQPQGAQPDIEALRAQLRDAQEAEALARRRAIQFESELAAAIAASDRATARATEAEALLAVAREQIAQLQEANRRANAQILALQEALAQAGRDHAAALQAAAQQAAADQAAALDAAETQAAANLRAFLLQGVRTKADLEAQLASARRQKEVCDEALRNALARIQALEADLARLAPPPAPPAAPVVARRQQDDDELYYSMFSAQIACIERSEHFKKLKRLQLLTREILEILKGSPLTANDRVSRIIFNFFLKVRSQTEKSSPRFIDDTILHKSPAVASELKELFEEYKNCGQGGKASGASSVVGAPPPQPATMAAAAPGSPLQARATRATVTGSHGRDPASLPAAGKRSGGGKPPTPSISKSSFCETMLTLLLLDAQQIQGDSFDYQAFLDKAGATLDDLGQCPIVLHTLNKLIDNALENNVKGDSFTFKQIIDAPQHELAAIEKAYNNRFSEEDQEAFEQFSPTILFSKPPEEHDVILGKTPYMLNMRGDYDSPLEGFDEPIYVSKEEREEITTGGIPLGALVFLYLNCLRQIESMGNTPSLNSKCLLPTRSKEMAKTPKAKSPRKRKQKA